LFSSFCEVLLHTDYIKETDALNNLGLL